MIEDLERAKKRMLDSGGANLLSDPPPHGKMARHGSEQGGQGLETVPER